MVTNAERDAYCRRLIEKWMADGLLHLFTPQARASALMTVSRVAGELAEEEMAKVPDGE